MREDEWGVFRVGGRRAIVRKKEPRALEGFGLLAAKIGLNEEEKTRWLSPTERDDEYEIPNTIFAFWGGDLGRLGRWYVRWHSELAELRALGFCVEEFRFAPQHRDRKGESAATSRVLQEEYLVPQLRSLGLRKELHGILWWSHGLAPILREGEIVPTQLLVQRAARVDYRAIEKALLYKLGFVVVNACYARAGAETWVSSSPGRIFLASPNVVNPVLGGGFFYGDRMFRVRDGISRTPS